MTERMLVGTIAGVRLKYTVGLDIEHEGEDTTGVPCPGATHATISISPPYVLVPGLIAQATSVFPEGMSLELVEHTPEVTILHASVEDDKSEAMRQAYLSILGHRVLLAANGGKSFLTKDELPLDPPTRIRPPRTTPH